MATALTKFFGAYANLTTSSTAQNKTDMIAILNAFNALFNQEGPSVAATSAGNNPVYPEFMLAPPELVAQINAEVQGMIATINASP